jgi:hypothetical protein
MNIMCPWCGKTPQFISKELRGITWWYCCEHQFSRDPYGHLLCQMFHVKQVQIAGWGAPEEGEGK